MAEDNEALGSAGVQQIEDKQFWRGSTINGAYERVEEPKADPPVQPEIQLMEGWRNGNIHFDTVAPTTFPIGGHTWDIRCVVNALSYDPDIDPSQQLQLITAMYVSVPKV